MCGNPLDTFLSPCLFVFPGTSFFSRYGVGFPQSVSREHAVFIPSSLFLFFLGSIILCFLSIVRDSHGVFSVSL